MKRSVSLSLGLALAISAVACAGTNRDVASPDAEQAEQAAAVERSQVAVIPAPPPTIPANVDQNQIPVVKDQAALEPTNDPQVLAAQEEAKTEAEQNAREQKKWDKLGRDADRKNTDAYARDRLAKASARVSAVQNASSRVQGKRRLKLTHDIADFTAKKGDVESRIESLKVAGSDEWQITKQSLDEAINQLDAISYRVEGDM